MQNAYHSKCLSINLEGFQKLLHEWQNVHPRQTAFLSARSTQLALTCIIAPIIILSVLNSVKILCIAPNFKQSLKISIEGQWVHFQGGKSSVIYFFASMGANSKQTEFDLVEANHSFKNRPHFRSRAVTIYQFIGATIYCMMEICYNLQQSKGRTLDFICRMHTRSNLLSTLCLVSEDRPHG